MAGYPGPYAVPGLFWAGLAVPGNPVTAGSVTPPSTASTFMFLNSCSLTYPQYRDGVTMRTLVAQPGSVYTLVPIGGNPGLSVLPDDDDERWIPFTG